MNDEAWNALVRASDERHAAEQARQQCALADKLCPEDPIVLAHYDRLVGLAAATLAGRGRPFDCPPLNAPQHGCLRRREPGWDFGSALSIWITASGRWGWVEEFPPPGRFSPKSHHPRSGPNYMLDEDGQLLVQQSGRECGAFWTRLDQEFVDLIA